jgi:tetratricopeptide (TPR) repeat protein
LAPEAARRYETVLRLLSKASFDGELENLRCVLTGAGGATREYVQALSQIDELLEANPDSAVLRALRGKTLLNLGRAEEAAAELDRALALSPGLETALRWRAQTKLAGGAADVARGDLAQLGGGEPLLDGLAHAVRGDAEKAEQSWSKLLRRRPRSAAARALLGLSLAGRGRISEGRKALEAAVRDGGRAPLLLGLRGLVARQEGRYEESLRDLTEALDGEPMPWLFSHRADLLNRMGFYKEALADLKKLSELAPSGPEPFAQAANILFDQGYYDAALRAASRAIELAPGQPRLLARRAVLLSVCGRWQEAADELARARRLAPDDASLEIEWLSMRVRTEPRVLLRELGSWRGPKAWRSFLEGRCLARLRRYREAERAFRRVPAAGEAPFDRARLYATACRVLSAEKARGRAGRGLVLCGIGVRHPYEATVEIVGTLLRSEVIYSNVPDPQVAEFLSLFPAEIRAIPRPLGGSDVERAGGVLADFGRGPAAFVTRIHPFIYRRLGFELTTQSRPAGIPTRAHGAVSLTELAAALSTAAGASAGAPAWQALDIREALARPDRLARRTPVVVYCISKGAERRELARVLGRVRSKSESCWLLAGSGDREFEVRRLTIAGLGPALETADDACVVFLEPAAVSRRRRQA